MFSHRILSALSRMGPLTILATGAWYQLQNFQSSIYKNKPSLCDSPPINDSSTNENTTTTIKPVIDKNLIESSAVDDVDVWEEKRASCSFCRTFLDSPCNLQFKYWSKCVDMAKDLELDYVKDCAEYSSKLFECTDDHREYFESLPSPEPSEEDTDTEEGEQNQQINDEEVGEVHNSSSSSNSPNTETDSVHQ